MKFYKYILIVLTVFLHFTCKKESRCDCLKGTGKIVKEERSLPHVRNFKFGKGKLNCFIANDSVFKVEIEAGSNLIELIKTEVKDDTLFFTNHNRCNFTRSYKPQINIYISTPDLASIKQMGVGTIQSTNTLTGNSIAIETWSSGDIKLDLNCDYFYTHLHEGTAVYAKGIARVHNSYMWHSSTFFGENLITSETYVFNNSTGNFYCEADSLLSVSMLLSGDVIYSGNPNVQVIDLGGTGKVIRK